MLVLLYLPSERPCRAVTSEKSHIAECFMLVAYIAQ